MHVYRVASNTMLSSFSVPATILEDPVRDSVFAPDTISVVCRASGFPVPTITWIRTSMNGSVTELFSSSHNLNITEQVDKVIKLLYMVRELLG